MLIRSLSIVCMFTKISVLHMHVLLRVAIYATQIEISRTKPLLPILQTGHSFPKIITTYHDPFRSPSFGIISLESFRTNLDDCPVTNLSKAK